MRRPVILALSLVLVASGAAGAGVAAAGASTAAPAAKPKATVSIVSSSKCKPVSTFCYKPAKLKVARGTKVTFVNKTLTTHTITRCSTASCAGHDGGTGTDTEFGSGSVPANGKYSFVFNGKGTYVYFCAIHGYGAMHGQVTVNLN